MHPIDLRSDTITRPTPAMRQAMAEAPVGDDVYGEDPTVNRLQEEAARRLGMQAALFVPSGTMANQVALRVLGRPGDVVLCGASSHLLLYESGAPWALAGMQVQAVGSESLFDGADLRRALHPDEYHFAPTRIVEVENTHNHAGGRVFPLDLAKDVATAAREADMSLHLDGARLFNAEVATGTPVSAWAELFDTVSFCLSKGLGAPVGSLVCGSAELLAPMRRARKLLGGGMRQAGVLAAAGLHALEHHVARLADDHANARRLAAGLERLGLRVDPPPETNIVNFEVENARAFARELEKRSLRISAPYPGRSLPDGAGRFRAVTHLDVSETDVEDALGRIEEIVREGAR